ncbi:hypothetical protein GCM10010172_07560 [Paractinoplanes ferrugineus]|uniref:Uncharacterized protein n=1 Tax=Paractinoplanes ferrugineus TaxID=113564 RepID=A0A919JB79_9ACTN|nr:hypothetical protein [Actinoplanes ferrugineus]GIE16859.1 hypothetical protein Afe05nite_86990 [Actinoplanes ferrugineus]
MARYVAWKTVIDGTEKKHRSENKTYDWLRQWAADQADGAKVEVFVQEQYSQTWHVFERHVVRSGVLEEF